MTAFRHLVLAGVALLLLTVAPKRADAIYTLTLNQVGGNVTLTGSGTLNTTALTNAGTDMIVNGFDSSYPYASVGANSENQVQLYSGVTGPANFGSTSDDFIAAGGTGTVTAVDAANYLVVPPNYISGSALSGTNTLASQTFASIGFTPGTYTYTWGTGTNADSFIVTSGVPEPSTWAWLAAGAMGIVLSIRGRLRSQAAA